MLQRRWRRVHWRPALIVWETREDGTRTCEENIFIMWGAQILHLIGEILTGGEGFMMIQRMTRCDISTCAENFLQFLLHPTQTTYCYPPTTTTTATATENSTAAPSAH